MAKSYELLSAGESELRVVLALLFIYTAIRSFHLDPLILKRRIHNWSGYIALSTSSHSASR